jgi:hypothetical protein
LTLCSIADLFVLALLLICIELFKSIYNFLNPFITLTQKEKDKNIGIFQMIAKE